VTPDVSIYFSAWLSGRDVLAARILESAPASALGDRAESELQKLVSGTTTE